MFGFVSPSTRLHTRRVPTVVHIFEIVSRLFWTLAPDLLRIAFVFRDLFTHFFFVCFTVEEESLPGLYLVRCFVIYAVLIHCNNTSGQTDIMRVLTWD
jgi:hypothetical protein